MGFFGFNDETDEMVHFCKSEPKATNNRTNHILALTRAECATRWQSIGGDAWEVAIALADNKPLNRNDRLNTAWQLYYFSIDKGVSYSEVLDALCEINENARAKTSERYIYIRTEDFFKVFGEVEDMERIIDIVAVKDAENTITLLHKKLLERVKGDVAFAIYKIAQGQTEPHHIKNNPVFAYLAKFKVWQLREILNF